MSEKTEFTPKLAKINNTYLPMIERQMQNNSIVLSEYSKLCVMNAIAGINNILDAKGISWNDPDLDQSNLTQTLLSVATLELNAASQPRECYFQLRNVKKTVKTENGGTKDVWKKVIEFGIEGDGHDRLLAKFGRNVAEVLPHWIVRENDDFTYPTHNGLNITPPTWTPKGGGEVVRIVYPVIMKGGIGGLNRTVHYYIGEREDVARNLLAHINNNIMNETFGICKDRYKATQAELAKIAEKKAEIKAKAKQLGLDALDDPELAPYISPSWKEDFSRESMIIRKIRNNIVKKIPKDFGSALAQDKYMESSSESYKATKENIIEGTASVIVEPFEALTAAEIVEPATGDKEPAGEEKAAEKAENAPTDEELQNRQKPDFD